MVVSVFIYTDRNRNGVYDLGDAPMMDVVVEMSGHDIRRTNRSNSGGYTNFEMSATLDHVAITKEGEYLFETITPPGWHVTSNNGTQTAEFKKMTGAPGDFICLNIFKPVGLAPNLIIKGKVKNKGQSFFSRDIAKNIQVTAVSPSGKDSKIKISRSGNYLFPASVGTWQIIATNTETGAVVRRNFEVKYAPVTASTIIIGEQQVDNNWESFVVDFESITRRPIFELPKGYGGIGWGNLIAVEQMKYGGPGYKNGTVSGNFVSYNSSGHPIVLSNENGFNFDGGYFSVAWRNAEGEKLIAKAWRDGKVIATEEVELSSLGPVWFDANYKNIHRLDISTKHYWQFVGDDFKLAIPDKSLAILSANELQRYEPVIKQPQTTLPPSVDFTDGIPNLSQDDKSTLIQIARETVDLFFKNKTYTEPFPKKYNGIGNRVFVGFRINGRKKGSWSSQKKNLAESVHYATLRTLNDTRYNGSITSEDIDKLQIELYVIGDMTSYNDYPANYEHGYHGLFIKKAKKTGWFYNTVATENNWYKKYLFKRLCLKARLPEECFYDNSVSKYYFPTLHFATTRFSDEIITFYRSNTLLPEGLPSKEQIEHSNQLATDWLLANLNTQGYFNYLYYPSKDSYSQRLHLIRQLMPARTLAVLSTKHQKLKPLHRKNLDYIFKHWYKELGDDAYIHHNGDKNLGALSFLLRTLVESPFYNKHQQHAKKLAYTILSMQHDDGSLNAIYGKNDSNRDRGIVFYSGEAILALADYYNKTRDKTILNAAEKSQQFYIEEYVNRKNRDFSYYLIPWHTQSLNKLYKITKNKEYANALFKLNDLLVGIQTQDSHPFPDRQGAFDIPKHGPYSASDAVNTEGLSYAYEIAKMLKDTNRQKTYKRAMLLGTKNLINLQYRNENMYFVPNHQKVKGAIRGQVTDNSIRVDSIQHAIDAFHKILSQL